MYVVHVIGRITWPTLHFMRTQTTFYNWEFGRESFDYSITFAT